MTPALAYALTVSVTLFLGQRTFQSSRKPVQIWPSPHGTRFKPTFLPTAYGISLIPNGRTIPVVSIAFARRKRQGKRSESRSKNFTFPCKKTSSFIPLWLLSAPHEVDTDIYSDSQRNS